MSIRSWVLPSLTGYQGRWLSRDIVAGLVLSALLVPQGMAYAELAGLPAVTGLYTSILCLVGYALVGPSRILVLGPDSSLGPMIAATILPLIGADGDPAKAVVLASGLAILTGLMMIAAGAGRLGFVADLLSKPTILGYMNGLALTILVGQLPKLLGFSVDADGFIGEVVGFVTGIVDGEVVLASAAIGLLTLAIMLVLGRCSRRSRPSSWPSWPRSSSASRCRWPTAASRSSARSTRACRSSRSRRSASTTCPCWSSAPSASPSSPWPTPSPPRPRSPSVRE